MLPSSLSSPPPSAGPAFQGRRTFPFSHGFPLSVASLGAAPPNPAAHPNQPTNAPATAQGIQQAAQKLAMAAPGGMPQPVPGLTANNPQPPIVQAMGQAGMQPGAQAPQQPPMAQPGQQPPPQPGMPQPPVPPMAAPPPTTLPANPPTGLIPPGMPPTPGQQGQASMGQGLLDQGAMAANIPGREDLTDDLMGAGAKTAATSTDPTALHRGWQWKALNAEQDENTQNWLPRLFTSKDTPVAETLASPGKQSLLGGLLGAGLGGAVGGLGASHLGLDPTTGAGVGAGLGGLIGGVHAYGSRRRKNDSIVDAMRFLPPGATLGEVGDLNARRHKTAMDDCYANGCSSDGQGGCTCQGRCTKCNPRAKRAADMKDRLHRLMVRRGEAKCCDKCTGEGTLCSCMCKDCPERPGFFTATVPTPGDKRAFATPLLAGATVPPAAGPPTQGQSEQKPKPAIGPELKQKVLFNAAKLAALSATGESGLAFNYKDDHHAKGQDAWASLDHYFKGGSRLASSPNPSLGRHRGEEKSAGGFGWVGSALQAGKAALPGMAKALPGAAHAVEAEAPAIAGGARSLFPSIGKMWGAAKSFERPGLGSVPGGAMNAAGGYAMAGDAMRTTDAQGNPVEGPMAGKIIGGLMGVGTGSRRVGAAMGHAGGLAQPGWHGFGGALRGEGAGMIGDLGAKAIGFGGTDFQHIGKLVGGFGGAVHGGGLMAQGVKPSVGGAAAVDAGRAMMLNPGNGLRAAGRFVKGEPIIQAGKTLGGFANNPAARAGMLAGTAVGGGMGLHTMAGSVGRQAGVNAAGGFTSEMTAPGVPEALGRNLGPRMMQGAAHGVGEGFMGHADKLLSMIGLHPERMTDTQKWMLMGGTAGAGLGLATGHPGVAGLAGLAAAYGGVHGMPGYNGELEQWGGQAHQWGQNQMNRWMPPTQPQARDEYQAQVGRGFQG